MLLLVTWAAVVSSFRYVLPPSSVGPEVVTMLTVFVVLALIVSRMLRVAPEHAVQPIVVIRASRPSIHLTCRMPHG
jgi:hypothetical protein